MREKASDIYRSGNIEFPEIEDISIKIEEVNATSTEPTKRSVYHSIPGAYYNCSNPVCYGGGFRLGTLISEMITAKSSELSETKHCIGYEGTRKRRTRECLHFFNVKISIKYNEINKKHRPVF
jgi:hypothetical protein